MDRLLAAKLQVETLKESIRRYKILLIYCVRFRFIFTLVDVYVFLCCVSEDD